MVRQDIRVVSKLIRSSVRALTPEDVTIEDNGATLIFTPDVGGGTIVKKVERNLVLEEGGDENIVIANHLSDLKFELVPGHAAETTLLKVTLTIDVHNASSTAVFTTGFRNKSET